MGLTMAQRKAVTRELAQRYRRATRREKGEILDQRVQLTGHTRNHASWLLRGWGRTVYSYQGGRPVKIVVGTRRPRRHSPRYYDQEVVSCTEASLGVVRRDVRQAPGGGAASPVAGAGEVRGAEPGTAGARQAAAHQRRHQRPVAARGETQAAAPRTLPHQAQHPPDASDPDPHLHRMGGCQARRGGRRPGGSRRRPRRRRACLHPGGDRPRHPVDGATCGAEQGRSARRQSNCGPYGRGARVVLPEFETLRHFSV